jgi:hypothetical protein
MASAGICKVEVKDAIKLPTAKNYLVQNIDSTGIETMMCVTYLFFLIHLFVCAYIVWTFKLSDFKLQVHAPRVDFVSFTKDSFVS